MAKQTKRSRKFTAKGGVKAGLKKGTITYKGKVKRKRRSQHDGAPSKKPHFSDAGAPQEGEKQRSRDENDFAGRANIHDMDIDSFFESFADKAEQGKGEPVNEEIGSSASDDGEDSSEEENDDNDNRKEEDSEESGSDSDDDVDAAEERMKLQMDKLRNSDPEFHKFLDENERSLLDFGQDEEEEEESAAVGDGENIEQKTQQIEGAGSPRYKHVDSKLLKSLEQGAFKSHGVKSLKKLVSIFKTACHLSDSNQNDENEDFGKNSNKKNYHIDSSEIFDKLMVLSLNRCHEEFHYHLLGEGAGRDGQDQSSMAEDDDSTNEDNDAVNTQINPKVFAKSDRWLEIKPILQSFLKSTLHLLGEAKDPDLLTFILKALSNYVPFLTPYPRITLGLLKSLTGLWSAPLDTSEDYQVVRLNAFLRIRQLTLTQPFPFIEDCLKKTYLAYANRAKFGTSASLTSLLPTLTFMGNCVVELYSLDYHSSYQHAFVYIRQLALHLRTALQKKTPDALQAVYCWQYMHCLKLWVAVLTATCKENLDDDAAGRADEVQLMRSLVYPLTEIILGVARLVPTARHLPLRLHCVRYLQQLAATAELYIPTTSILLDVFDLKEIGMKPKKIQGRGGARGIQLPIILKLPKDSPLRSAEQLEACLSEVFLLLNREADLYRYSAGFPEFSVRICQRLRKFSKETKNGRWRAYAKGCIDVCERYSALAVKGRAGLGEAPKDVKRLEVLKPSGEPTMGERYDAAISKENRLEAAARPAAKTKQLEGRPSSEEDEDMYEEEPNLSTHTKKAPTKSRKGAVNESDLANVKALEEDDVVAEGIDWMDDEGESVDESD